MAHSKHHGTPETRMHAGECLIFFYIQMPKKSGDKAPKKVVKQKELKDALITNTPYFENLVPVLIFFEKIFVKNVLNILFLYFQK